jgi:hypothetical protein
VHTIKKLTNKNSSDHTENIENKPKKLKSNLQIDLKHIDLSKGNFMKKNITYKK